MYSVCLSPILNCNIHPFGLNQNLDAHLKCYALFSFIKSKIVKIFSKFVRFKQTEPIAFQTKIIQSVSLTIDIFSSFMIWLLSDASIPFNLFGKKLSPLLRKSICFSEKFPKSTEFLRIDFVTNYWASFKWSSDTSGWIFHAQKL